MLSSEVICEACDSIYLRSPWETGLAIQYEGEVTKRCE